MNNKDLLKAIGDIDEKYLIEETDIEETNRIASNNKVNIMKKIYIKLVLKCDLKTNFEIWGKWI